MAAISARKSGVLQHDVQDLARCVDARRLGVSAGSDEARNINLVEDVVVGHLQDKSLDAPEGALVVFLWGRETGDQPPLARENPGGLLELLVQTVG